MHTSVYKLTGTSSRPTSFKRNIYDMKASYLQGRVQLRLLFLVMARPTPQPPSQDGVELLRIARSFTTTL